MKTKLELTWYGKDKEIYVEPRILIENKELSNIENDQNTENMLIHGDNLLALKALEKDYSNRIKCIYIDPPYNTGSAFEHYDDNLEHSTWLSLMKPRLEILHSLLKEDGSIWISIDDDEGHYLKLLCDEVFGRSNYINTVIWEKKYSPQNDAKWLSDNHDFILVYAKNKDIWRPNLLPRSVVMNDRYKNPDNDPRGPWKPGDLSVKTYTPSCDYAIVTPSGRTVNPPAGRCWRATKDRFEELVLENRIWFGEDGNNVPAIKRFLTEVKDGMTPMTIWKYTDVGHNQEARREVKVFNEDSVFDTPKPEKLIERILTLGSNEGDIVLDSFLGSGTTSAVAHKMNRRWIGIELGNHAYTHCKVRLDAVVSGEDIGGISYREPEHVFVDQTIDSDILSPDEAREFNKLLNKVNRLSLLNNDEYQKLKRDLKDKLKTKKISHKSWHGGGGYRFYELAPSLINIDEFGEAVINKDYNAAMLASAVALHEGYTYEPSERIFWKQSKANEHSYLFVTTRHVSFDYLNSIVNTMEEDEFLVISCKSFDESIDRGIKNVVIKKIPQMLLDRCEFGKDNYNLNIINPPIFEDEEEDYIDE